MVREQIWLQIWIQHVAKPPVQIFKAIGLTSETPPHHYHNGRPYLLTQAPTMATCRSSSEAVIRDKCSLMSYWMINRTNPHQLHLGITLCLRVWKSNNKLPVAVTFPQLGMGKGALYLSDDLVPLLGWYAEWVDLSKEMEKKTKLFESSF